MFHPIVENWFNTAHEGPTPCQARAWPAIREGRDVLVSAPTGSGKTLAAFLAAIDELTVELIERGCLEQSTRILYVSPLKALSNDIEKNLRAPLDAINAALADSGCGGAITAAVRTGDTPPAVRERMKKTPPHILVTTPESLYILLTSDSGRRILSAVRTVIVDEIHALAPNKRGAHLALSLARLDHLIGARPVRIGLSATQRPLSRVAEFLAGSGLGAMVQIVDDGSGRDRDLDLMLPDSPLEAVMAGEVWGEIYRKLAEEARVHRTTLVFVNTRRQAERVARHLGELLGEDKVTSHHGSLSREHRFDAETRLKAGSLKVLVATASLELGIDIGEVDLVCQLGSPRSVSVFLQRVGRSGHGVGRTPKGRLVPLSRDDLVECVALLDCCRRQDLDEIDVPKQPLDVLAQQIVAEAANQEWTLDGMYRMVRHAMPYGDLPRAVFDDVLKMLAEGFSTRRGRRGALLHVDLVGALMRGRKGARLTALTNGGAIPDLFDYDVILEPEGQQVGTLNEDFAFESLAGDVFQLGNTSYRILRIEKGTVRVADAKGQPPNIPFWFGEAPGRGDTLSSAVSDLRSQVSAWMPEGADQTRRNVVARYAIDEVAAGQLVDYLGAAWEALGGLLPTRERLVAERFFDAAGDMHLVIHSPYGSRLNRALGLALRKRFCRRFNFELQASAVEDSVVLSLGATHSFDLAEVASYLSSSSVRSVLIQALLDAPVFPTHWRWVANISLAVRRFANGRKVPAQFQRSDAEDLVAVVFPDQLACFENIQGEREVPDHPLVNQAIRDCVDEVMDVSALERLLERLEAGEVAWVGRDLVAPSPLSDEIVNARPYAFLDDAPAEERRTLAVRTRGPLPGDDSPRDHTIIDPAAVARVREEAWPQPADADECHDALVSGGFLTEAEVTEAGPLRSAQLAQLAVERRATVVETALGIAVWCAAERLAEVLATAPAADMRPPIAAVSWHGSTERTADDALTELLRSRLEVLGPVTAERLAASLGVERVCVDAALERLRLQGFAIAGRFDEGADESQWCDRRLLARIHRYTLESLRKQVQPVSLAAWLRFLFEWQHLDAAGRMEGVDGVAEVLSQLEGRGVPLKYWETEILPARVYGYHPALLDQIALSGRLRWRRCLGRPRRAPGRRADGRAIGAAPVAFYPRDGERFWAGKVDDVDAKTSASASAVLGVLEQRGPSFYDELQSATGMLPSQLESALSELVVAGRVTCDSFNGLRGLLVPESRRRSPGRVLQRRGRRLSSTRIEQAGRWSLTESHDDSLESVEVGARDQWMGYLCDVLLHRFGVVCRAVVEMEKGVPPWREFLGMLRRMEARGEVRGGRFVAAFTGEQFALPEAIEMLRRHRREPPAESLVRIHAADPLNVTGTILPKERVSGDRTLLFRNGTLIAVREEGGVRMIGEHPPEVAWRAREKLFAATVIGGPTRSDGPRRQPLI